MATSSHTQIGLCIIDPQNSFCHPMEGELYVPGAEKDMQRLSKFLERWLHRIDGIYVTLDSHHELDVAHPIFWRSAQGGHPEPFTTITKQNVIDGVWKPFDPKRPSPPFATLQERMLHYVSTLEEGGRYQLTIWPPHCRIGTPGHNIVQPLRETLGRWELERYKAIEFVLKGDNIFTEHYSGVQAEVPDPEDVGTHLNRGMIQALQKMDLIVFSGEASSHCVANTMRDIAGHFGADVLNKWVLLEDAMSPVPGFEQFAEDFFQEMRTKGVTITTTLDFSL